MGLALVRAVAGEALKWIAIIIILVCVIGAIAFSGAVKALLMVLAAGFISYLLKQTGMEDKYVVIIFLTLMVIIIFGFKLQALTIISP